MGCRAGGVHKPVTLIMEVAPDRCAAPCPPQLAPNSNPQSPKQTVMKRGSPTFIVSSRALPSTCPASPATVAAVSWGWVQPVSHRGWSTQFVWDAETSSASSAPPCCHRCLVPMVDAGTCRAYGYLHKLGCPPQCSLCRVCSLVSRPSRVMLCLCRCRTADA
jgi:hypothetical protein